MRSPRCATDCRSAKSVSTKTAAAKLRMRITWALPKPEVGSSPLSPEVKERSEFPDYYYRGDNGDLRAIDEMLERLRLDWDEDKLTELRHEARRLVERERSHIRLVAAALIEHRHLTAADLRRLVGLTLRQ